MKQKDEAQIISKVLAGDLEEYSQLVARYQQGLYIHCFRLVSNEATAEDLAQESFIKAYNRLDKFNPKFRFSTWLYQIATNICLDHLKKHKELALSEYHEVNLAGPDINFNQNIQNDEIRAIVSKLPPDLRVPTSLFYWQMNTVKEISNLLNISEGLVKVRLHRARNILRKELSI